MAASTPVQTHRHVSRHSSPSKEALQEVVAALKTTFETLHLLWTANRDILFKSWFLVPAGVVIMLLIIMGVDLLIGLSGISFPASVACMFGLFIILMICNSLVGHRNTSKLVKVLDVPCGFCLRWLNLQFTPSFVTLPLSPAVSFTEVLKIAAVFVFGFLLAMVVTAWSVRGITLVLGGPKTNPVNRIDDAPQQESIPLQEIASIREADQPPDIQSDSGDVISPPARAAETSRIRGPGIDLPSSNQSSTANLLDEHQRVTPMPMTRPQRIAAIISANLDGITWSILWVIGFIIYMTTGYSMPAQLPLNILTFLLAMRITPGTRRFIHPIFPCAGLTILGIFALAAIQGQSLDQGLEQYKTGTPYIRYYFGPKNNLPPPGAGDLLAAVLDVSIVALAIPMFNYRAELKRHYVAILLPTLAIAVASLFLYPLICAQIGIDSSRALAFPARSVTLALATPVVNNLGGSIPLVVVIAILSGIIGVLVGDFILNFLKIPLDDYVTRGVSLGVNASAISTAQLLRTDPRAAALSSLSFAVFGALMVILTAIPPVADRVKSLAGA